MSQIDNPNGEGTLSFPFKGDGRLINDFLVISMF